MLKCGSGFTDLIPFEDWEGDCMVGGVNLGTVGGVKGGGLNLVSGLRDCVASGVEGAIPTVNPAAKLGC